MSTTKDTVRLLCKSIVTHLENDKSISFPPRLRQIVGDEVFGLVGPYILTEEDLRERALAKVGAKIDSAQVAGFAESDQFKAAKAVVRQSFGDDELNGFFFQKSIKFVAQTIAQYLMRSSHIDEVYETDDDLEKQIVESVKGFNPANQH